MNKYTISIKTASVDISKYTIFDSPNKKIVFIRFTGFPCRLVLWEADQYDSIADYTQSMIDSRISELLGDNPQQFLQNLIDITFPHFN